MKHTWEDPDLVQSWSQAVGMNGDLFQQYFAKSFIAACLQLFLDRQIIGDQGVEKVLGLYHESIMSSLQTPSMLRGEVDFSNFLRGFPQSHDRTIRIMDFGSGEGFLGRWLSYYGVSYLGLDISKLMLEEAHKKQKNLSGALRGNMRFVLKDVEEANQKSFRALSEKHLGSPWPDIALSTAMLDHIQDPSQFLQTLSRWLADRNNGTTPFIVVTLNPAFFRPRTPQLNEHAHQTEKVAPSDAGHGAVDIPLGPAGQWVKAYLRETWQYERLFVDNGFHVLYCACPNLRWLPNEQRMEAEGQSGNRGRSDGWSSVFTGPFVMWYLLPRKTGKRVNEHGLKILMSGASPFRYLSAIQRNKAESNRHLISVVELPKSEVIEYPGNLFRSFYVVHNGVIERHNEEGVAQIFVEGDILGEFEAGRNLVSDRFLFKLKAGDRGGTVFAIPLNLLETFLDDDPSTFASSLYRTLRERMSRYSWIWFKREEKGRSLTRPLTHTREIGSSQTEQKEISVLQQPVSASSLATMTEEAEDEAEEVSLTDPDEEEIGSWAASGLQGCEESVLEHTLSASQGPSVSDRDVEYFSRGLLFGLTFEASVAKSGWANVMFVHPHDLYQFIYNKLPKGKLTGLFSKVIRPLVQAGVIDVAIWRDALKSKSEKGDDPETAAKVSQLMLETREKIIDVSFDIIVRKPLADLGVEGHKISNDIEGWYEDVKSDLMSDQNSLMRQGRVKNNHLTKRAIKFLKALSPDIRLRPNPAIFKMAQRWIANLAVVDECVFNDTRSVLFIRDYYFLRDIAFRSSEVSRRIELRKAGADMPTYSNMERGRWSEYTDAVLEYLVERWSSSGSILPVATQVFCTRSSFEMIMKELNDPNGPLAKG